MSDQDRTREVEDLAREMNEVYQSLPNYAPHMACLNAVAAHALARERRAREEMREACLAEARFARDLQRARMGDTEEIEEHILLNTLQKVVDGIRALPLDPADEGGE